MRRSTVLCGMVPFIEGVIPHILPWTTHEDWWLHESAFTALMGLREDETTFARYKDTEDGMLLNMIVDLTKLRKPSAGWHAIGTPTPVERMWRYHSFGPVSFNMKSHKTPQTSFEDASLPPEMKNWFKPDFDDRQWKSGHTPIGVGVFKAYGAHSIGWTATPNFSFKNNSDWGTGQYLLMRTNFEVTNLDDDMYRIKVLTDQGFILYLNGQKLHSQGRNESIPAYRCVLLGDKAMGLLKKGTNTLAVQTKVRYEEDKKAAGQFHPVGQIDLFLEGLKKKELGLAP